MLFTWYLILAVYQASVMDINVTSIVSFYKYLLFAGVTQGCVLSAALFYAALLLLCINASVSAFVYNLHLLPHGTSALVSPHTRLPFCTVFVCLKTNMNLMTY